MKPSWQSHEALMPLQFGRFSLDPGEYRLLRDGRPLALSPRPFDLLVALTARAGQLVTREELLREVWKDTVVEQSSLNAAMSVLRQALGDDAASLIETVPGRGYRFIAPVTPADAPAPLPAPGSTGPAVRVLIVDDHAVVRMGVRALIERAGGFQVIGEAGTLDECGDLVHSRQPDLLVLDLMMGDEPSIDRIKAWRLAAPGLRVVVLSMHHEDAYARRALAAGAHGYVMKAEMLGELRSAIDAVIAGDVWVSAQLSKSIVKDFVDGRPLSG
jgi:DNA-binding response OmpR family regulator